MRSEKSEKSPGAPEAPYPKSEVQEETWKFALGIPAKYFHTHKLDGVGDFCCRCLPPKSSQIATAVVLAAVVVVLGSGQTRLSAPSSPAWACLEQAQLVRLGLL